MTSNKEKAKNKKPMPNKIGKVGRKSAFEKYGKKLKTHRVDLFEDQVFPFRHPKQISSADFRRMAYMHLSAPEAVRKIEFADMVINAFGSPHFDAEQIMAFVKDMPQNGTTFALCAALPAITEKAKELY